MCKMRKARIAYAGPALEDGTMDVRELAPALIAFADLVKYASRAINLDKNIKVMLNQDSLKKGSFDITFLLDTSLLEQAKLFMQGAEDTGPKDLMDVLGWGGTAFGLAGGIFGIIKFMKGRSIKAIKHDGNTAAQITLNDGTDLKLTENALKVLMDYECRKSIEKVVEPISKDGIDKFELRNPESDDKEAIESVCKDDAKSFKSPRAENALTNTYSGKMIFDIVSIVFEEEKKWKFSDGETTFGARIDDDDFWSKVEDGTYKFSKGDRLEVLCTVTQSTPLNGRSSVDRIITKVLQKIDRPVQIKLDFDNDDG